MESTYEDDYNNVVATAAAANGGNTFMMPSGCEEKLSTLTDGGNDGDDDGIDVGGDADADDSECEQFSALTTLMCDEKSVDDCCRLIGHLSAKWGYLEREIIYIVARRLEIFFHNSVKLPLGLFISGSVVKNAANQNRNSLLIFRLRLVDAGRSIAVDDGRLCIPRTNCFL